MFDMPGGEDVTAAFSSLGAYPNAFTSYDTTAYYFSCTDHFEECLRLLLRFVTTPYFTAETVEKEQGIIGQEIDMTADSPETRGYELLLKAMYRNHPISTPILGTRESIAQITPEILHACHRAYYAPQKMVLAVVGDVDADAIAALAEELLPKAEAAKITVSEPRETDMTCLQSEIRDVMDIPRPIYHLAFKVEDIPFGREAAKLDYIGNLAVELLCGETSPLYARLYEDGVIDSSFSYGFDGVSGAAHLIFAGEGTQSTTLREEIFAEAARLQQEGIDESDFRRMVRSLYAQRTKSLDSFDGTCYRLCGGHFLQFETFSFPELLGEITAEEVLAFLARVITRPRCALSVIEPLEEQQDE